MSNGILKALLESKAHSLRNVRIRLSPPPTLGWTLSVKRVLTSGSTIVLF